MDITIKSNIIRYIEKFKPEVIVLIQPNNPLVKPEDVDSVVQTLLKTKTNSCFSVVKISQRPEWMYYLDNKKGKIFLKEEGGPTRRSQELSSFVIINGAVYATKYDTLMKNNKIRDNNNTSTYLMPRERSVDIDDIFDFEYAKFLFRLNGKKLINSSK